MKKLLILFIIFSNNIINCVSDELPIEKKYNRLTLYFKRKEARDTYLECVTMPNGICSDRNQGEIKFDHNLFFFIRWSIEDLTESEVKQMFEDLKPQTDQLPNFSLLVEIDYNSVVLIRHENSDIV